MAKKKTVGTVENGLANATGCGYADMMQVGTIFSNATPYLLSLNWVQLANTYKNNGFTKVAVDLPVSDAFRNGGFEIDSNTLDAEEILKLKEIMSDYGDIETLKECLRWGRLYGGGAVIVSTEQDSTTPFNPTTIKGKEVKLYAVDRWQLSPNGANIQLADNFLLTDNRNTGAITFDKSRVMLYTGQTQPYYLRNQLQGWGASIFEAIIPQLNQYLKANSVILELLDEAKIDIIKINGLADTLASAGGDTAIRKRLEIASNNKNYKSMLAMDVNDDYQQKQLTFGGLDRILEKTFLLICSCLRIPYSKVFGRGANGFSSGEDDLENYNSMIDADIRVPATKILKQIIDIRCCQLFGRKIPDLIIKWKPLRVLNEKEEQEIKTSKINSYMQLFQAGIMTKKQVAEKLTNEQIILFSDDEIDNLDEEITEEELTETKENGKEEEKKESILKKIQNSLKAINDRWITIHPHGDAEDEDGKKDYRRLLIKDDETPKEAIDRVFKKNNKKAEEKSEVNKEQKAKDKTEIKSNYTFFKGYSEKLNLASEKLIKWQEKIEKAQKIQEKDKKLAEIEKLSQEKRAELNKMSYRAFNWTDKQLEYSKIRDSYHARVREINEKEGVFKAQEEYSKLLDEATDARIDDFFNATEQMGKRLKEISKDNDEIIKNITNKIPSEYKKALEDLNKARENKETAYKNYDANTDWLSEEKKELREKYNVAWSEFTKARAEVNKQKEEIARIVTNELKIKNGVEFKLEPTKTQEENAKRLKSVLDGVVPKEVYANPSMKMNTTSGRAYHSGSTINLNKNSNIETIIHETGHQLEEQNKTMLANSLAFASYRTEGEKQIALRKVYPDRAYKASEICKKDNFFSAYCGKFYNLSGGKNQTYINSTGSEIMSMGLQELFTNPVEFAQKDREYFDFVVANLRGIL